jgi:zinc D-Ala-D-Ala dipeptidase
LRYATENNFLKAKVYDCAECYLRYKTVKKLIEANDLFLKLGYRIKLFDCYRPLDVQKKMWKIVPNPIYVADPSKGSIHNRGCAVDIDFSRFKWKELDMGTDPLIISVKKLHIIIMKIVLKLLKNRKYYAKMESCSFKVFQSEWWHYNLATEPG